jgi:hypothetical protein
MFSGPSPPDDFVSGRHVLLWPAPPQIPSREWLNRSVNRDSMRSKMLDFAVAPRARCRARGRARVVLHPAEVAPFGHSVASRDAPDVPGGLSQLVLGNADGNLSTAPKASDRLKTLPASAPSSF